MELFKNRPFAFFCAVFMLASAAGFFVVGAVKLIAVAVAVAALITVAIIAIAKKNIFRGCFVSALAAVALIGGALSSYACFDIGYTEMRKYDGKICRIEGVVTDVVYQADYACAYEVRLSSVNRESCNKKIYFECEYASNLQLGYAFFADAELSEPRDTDFGYYKKINLISDGMSSVATCYEDSDCTVTDLSVQTPEIYFKSLKSDASARLSRAVGGEVGDLATAAFLADRTGLSDKTELDFSRAGISHMLALSGLHMAIVAALAEFVLKKLYVKRLLRCLVVSALLIFYLFLIGFALSAVRAVIMILVVYLSYILGVFGESRTSLFFAGFLILLIFPSAVCDVGFWMSFCAALGIIIVSPYLSKLFLSKRRDGDLKVLFRKVARVLVSAIVITLVANFSVLFFTWLFFGQISVLTPITNLIISPLLTLLVVFSALTLAFYNIAPVSDFFAWLARLIGDAIIEITARFSDMRGIVLSLRYDFVGYIVCAFCALMLVLLLIRLKRKYLVLLPFGVAVLSFCVCLGVFFFMGEGKISTAYVREKSGEELILSDRGRAVVCDFSEGYFSRLALGGAVAEELGATEIEVLVLTHYHSNQVSGVSRFFDNFKTRALWIPEPLNESDYEIMKELTARAEAAGVSTAVYKYGTKMKAFGKAEMEILSNGRLDRSVEVQTGVSILCGDSRLTYLSSAFLEGGSDISAKEAIKNSDCLILGAHGANAQRISVYDVGEGCEKLIIADSEAFDKGFIAFSGESRPNSVVAPEYFETTLE